MWGGPAPPNFNYNVTHHGALVAIAADPTCLIGTGVNACLPNVSKALAPGVVILIATADVGLDLMDTTERPRGGRKDALSFFSSFTENFTAGVRRASTAAFFDILRKLHMQPMWRRHLLAHL